MFLLQLIISTMKAILEQIWNLKDFLSIACPYQMFWNSWAVTASTIKKNQHFFWTSSRKKGGFFSFFNGTIAILSWRTYRFILMSCSNSRNSFWAQRKLCPRWSRTDLIIHGPPGYKAGIVDGARLEHEIN